MSETTSTAADSSVADRALHDLVYLAGASDSAERIRINAGPLSLNTRFHVAEAASAALSAGGLIASQLLDDGPRDVSVATRAAEASLMSYQFLHYSDAQRAPALRQRGDAPLGGFMQTGDGRWMFMHAGFPHNTESLLNLLGNPADRDGVKRALAKWQAPELEREIMQRGLCSAMVREPDEWDASALSSLLVSRPIVDIIQVGDADPLVPEATGSRPLDGYRVLDMTRVLAGPTCARTLASYGAEALRVGAEHLPSVPMFVTDTGHGKRTAYLDLREDSDCRQLDALLAEAHVFSQGYRTGAMERLGFGVPDVASKRPGIVYVSINCYGHEGPLRSTPGWEQLAQTVTGVAHMHGEHVNDGEPMLQPAAVTDYTTGYLAAFGALVALKRQRELGGTYWVRVSLSRTAMWLRSLGLRNGVAPSSIDDDEAETISMTSETLWGTVKHLQPAVAIDGTEVTWKQPAMPLGSSEAAWKSVKT